MVSLWLKQQECQGSYDQSIIVTCESHTETKQAYYDGHRVVAIAKFLSISQNWKTDHKGEIVKWNKWKTIVPMLSFYFQFLCNKLQPNLVCK